MQMTFPQPRKDMIEWHGLDDWAFLTLEYNPHTPTRPGFSGLFFTGAKAGDDWMTSEDVLRLFVRTKPSNWVYMGQYKMTPGPSLTSHLWKEQADIVSISKEAFPSYNPSDTQDVSTGEAYMGQRILDYRGGFWHVRSGLASEAARRGV